MSEREILNEMIDIRNTLEAAEAGYIKVDCADLRRQYAFLESEYQKEWKEKRYDLQG